MDIFCFQEIFDSESDVFESNGIRTHLFQEISNILNNHQGFYNPQLNGYDQAGEVKFNGQKILCGDFNLNPDTKSLNILDRGMKNLIKEYKVKSTRSGLYKKDQK